MLSLNNALDLLNKCKYDIDSLNHYSSHPEYDYMIFNAVVSLNHLFEWYIKDNTINESKKLDCINNFNPFITPYDVSYDFKKLYRQLTDFPEINHYQLNIRLLCNKAKHFNKKEIEKQEENITAVCGNMSAGSFNAFAGYFNYKYTIDINGIDEELDIIIRKLLNQWIEFCK